MRLKSLILSKSSQENRLDWNVSSVVLELECLPRHTEIGLELTANCANVKKTEALANVDEKVRTFVMTM